jgi:hypothetical protein
LAGIWSQSSEPRTGWHPRQLFPFGGHSLLATQVMSRVYKTVPDRATLRCLFELPTIAGWQSILKPR